MPWRFGALLLYLHLNLTLAKSDWQTITAKPKLNDLRTSTYEHVCVSVCRGSRRRSITIRATRQRQTIQATVHHTLLTPEACSATGSEGCDASRHAHLLPCGWMDPQVAVHWREWFDWMDSLVTLARVTKRGHPAKAKASTRH